jgi:hypothetical protein
MQKLCAKWVPPLLTMDQNQQRVNDSEQCFAIFNRNKDEFFSRYITMDDVTHPIDSQPSELNAMNRIQSVERRNGQQASVFWDVRGIIFRSSPRKGPDNQQQVLHSVFRSFKR